MLSVPEANVFAGLAEEAVKSAPDPTTAASGEQEGQEGAEREPGIGREEAKTGHGDG